MKRMMPGLVLATLLVGLVFGPTAWGASSQKFTIIMRDFSYSPSTITLQAGVPAEITLINRGKVAHEFMVYDRPTSMSIMGGEKGQEWAEKTNYFHMVNVTVTGGRVRRHGGDFMELTVASGKSATLRFTPTKKGTFEMGCMIKDHYEAGQHGTVIVK